MQAPAGNGLWPGLWMLPGPGAATSADNFEIDLQEGGYTNFGDPDKSMSWHEHSPNGTCGTTTGTAVDLTAGPHVYGLDWVPNQSLTYYLDGAQIGQITSAQCDISNEPMEIILDLQVANGSASGWHTVDDSSTPSPSVMKVLGVQVYQ